MILWFNGAFGAGKTMPFVEFPTGDFQDLPLWRHLVIQTMTGLAQ
ncbi:hypothetical protein ACQP2F_41665 [Actinoplanes sp. CA-030573]